jgi:hypothetical protein
MIAAIHIVTIHTVRIGFPSVHYERGKCRVTGLIVDLAFRDCINGQVTRSFSSIASDIRVVSRGVSAKVNSNFVRGLARL